MVLELPPGQRCLAEALSAHRKVDLGLPPLAEALSHDAWRPCRTRADCPIGRSASPVQNADERCIKDR